VFILRIILDKGYINDVIFILKFIFRGKNVSYVYIWNLKFVSPCIIIQFK